MTRTALLSGLALLTAASASPANAAVRRCVDRVTSGPQAAATMMQGRKLAIEAWSRAAATLGGEHGDWRNAGTRSLVCGPGPSSGVVCEARASPCAVEAPRKPVPGVKPKVPEPKVITVPPAAGKAI